MIVFDASGSMGGTDLNSVTPRIAKVRKALGTVLPEVASIRPIGLIVYGPGASNKCETIELRLRPALDASDAIMAEVESVVPAGRTPLTSAVSQAAEVLDYKAKPATIVLITDGEETCGGEPCNVAGLLEAKGKDLTIHVIGYRDKLATTGPFGSRCMADVSGGTYVSVETTDQLIEALRATLGCPYVTQRKGPGANANHLGSGCFSIAAAQSFSVAAMSEGSGEGSPTGRRAAGSTPSNMSDTSTSPSAISRTTAAVLLRSSVPDVSRMPCEFSRAGLNWPSVNKVVVLSHRSRMGGPTELGTYARIKIVPPLALGAPDSSTRRIDPDKR